MQQRTGRDRDKSRIPSSCQPGWFAALERQVMSVFLESLLDVNMPARSPHRFLLTLVIGAENGNRS
jgi:hypothetical protein